MTSLAWTTGAAVLAAVAGWALVDSPAEALARLTAGTVRRRDQPSVWLLSVLGPRPGAMRPRLRALVAAGAALLVALYSPGVSVAAVGAVAAVVGAATFVSLGRLEPTTARRRRTALLLELPQALDLLACSLEAGLPVRVATRCVARAMGGPVGEEFERVVALVDVGIAEPEAWRTLRANPALTLLADDMARACETGANTRASLRGHAEDARRARRAALVVRARSVGVRGVLPLALCFLPAFLLLGVIPTLAATVLPLFR